MRNSDEYKGNGLTLDPPAEELVQYQVEDDEGYRVLK